MANHNQYNKIVKRLDGRIFFCKKFYDYYGNDLGIPSNEVYLKSNVQEILAQVKEIYDSQQEELLKQKKRAEDFEIENYKLAKLNKVRK